MFKQLISLFAFLALFSSAAHARLSLIPGDRNQLFDYRNHYLTVRPGAVNIPERVKRNVLSQFFVKYKEYGIGYIEIEHYPDTGQRYRRVLFEYSKMDRDNYAFKADFQNIFDDQVFRLRGTYPLHLVVLQTDNEKNISKIKAWTQVIGNIAGPEYALVSKLFFQLLEGLEIPKETKEDYTYTLDKALIRKGTLSVVSCENNEPVMELEFTPTESIVEETDGDINELFGHSKFRNLDVWAKSAKTVNEKLRENGIGSLYSFYTAFADYITTLDLTKKDKALCLAAGICSWSKDVVGRGIKIGDKLHRFKAENYSELPNADLEALRNSKIKNKCMFEGGGCDTGECHAVYRFIRQSRHKKNRESIAEDILRGGGFRIFEQVPPPKESRIYDVGKTSYTNDFEILNNSKIDKKEYIGEGCYEYTFANLQLKYQERYFLNKKVTIQVDRDSRGYFISFIYLNQNI